MAFILKCTTCGHEWHGKDEHAAEVAEAQHPCKCSKRMQDLSLAELRKLAMADFNKGAK